MFTLKFEHEDSCSFQSFPFKSTAFKAELLKGCSKVVVFILLTNRTALQFHIFCKSISNSIIFKPIFIHIYKNDLHCTARHMKHYNELHRVDINSQPTVPEAVCPAQ